MNLEVANKKWSTSDRVPALKEDASDPAGMAGCGVIFKSNKPLPAIDTDDRLTG